MFTTPQKAFLDQFPTSRPLRAPVSRLLVTQTVTQTVTKHSSHSGVGGRTTTTVVAVKAIEQTQTRSRDNHKLNVKAKVKDSLEEADSIRVIDEEEAIKANDKMVMRDNEAAVVNPRRINSPPQHRNDNEAAVLTL